MSPPPILGKTYSLYGTSDSSTPYYKLVGKLVDDCLGDGSEISGLLAQVQTASKSNLLRRLAFIDKKSSLPAVLERGIVALSAYTGDVKQHLKELSLLKFREKALWTTERQYHLYMIEIELANRIHRDNFHDCAKKIALLPHCLRDFSQQCRSESDGIDLLCQHCSKKCFINKLSHLLNKYDVTPYIWMEADFKDFYLKLGGANRSLGILGIACIPELVAGMRRCMKYKIPVQGVPLDANRCRRWMGEFLENTVNLEEVEGVVQRNR